MFDADGDGVPEQRYYNGYRGGVDIVGPADAADGGATGTFEAVSTSAAKALGIERIAETCVQGRGVHGRSSRPFGDSRALIGYDDLMRIHRGGPHRRRDGRPRLPAHGYADLLLALTGAPDAQTAHGVCAVLDGRDEQLLGVDHRQRPRRASSPTISPSRPFPPASTVGCCAAAPLHEHCLFKLGIPLGELWHLTPLARWLRANGRSRFLLTAPPLRLPGAVGVAGDACRDGVTPASHSRDQRGHEMAKYESPYDPASAPKDLEHVLYEKKGHVAYVTINRPEVRNALHTYAYAGAARLLARHPARPEHLCRHRHRRRATPSAPAATSSSSRSTRPRASARRMRIRTARIFHWGGGGQPQDVAPRKAADLRAQRLRRRRRPQHRAAMPAARHGRGRLDRRPAHQCRPARRRRTRSITHCRARPRPI